MSTNPRVFNTEMGDYRAKVFYDREWEEYQVKLYWRGLPIPEATYHTDDRDDAERTAKHMVLEAYQKQIKPN